MILETFSRRSVPYNFVRIEETGDREYTVSWGQKSSSLYPEDEFNRIPAKGIVEAKRLAKQRCKGFNMPPFKQRKSK